MTDHPPTLQLLFGFVTYALLAGSIYCWLVVARRFRAGELLLADQTFVARPWGLVDLMLAVVLQAVLGAWLSERFGLPDRPKLDELAPDGRAAFVLASSTALLAAFFLSVGWLVARYRIGIAAFGIRIRSIPEDLRIGFAAFLLLAPIVYAIQWVLVMRFESKHPLIEILRENPDTRFFLLSGFAALVVAPIVEEYLFRLLLQGWLERLATIRRVDVSSLFGAMRRHPISDDIDPPAAAQVGGEQEVIVRPPLNDTDPQRVTKTSRIPNWPILVSATLFALAHYTHGPDPVPLFVFALGLGYLYQRTQRILPCILVHFLLNSCSLVGLWLSIYYGEVGG